MQYSNLHTHTCFSDGKHTPRENIESAISKGMRSLGFSDHSYTACDESYCMMPSSYPRYISEIQALKSEFRDTLPVFLGIEKDYYSDNVFSGFDYVMASVHYIVRGGNVYAIDHTAEMQLSCARDVFGGSILDVAKCYYGMVAEQAYLCKPDVIGHFDVISKFGLMPENSDEYLTVALDALRETAKYCNIFDINTGAIARGYKKLPYPASPLLTELKKLGVRVMINSDSHHKDNLDHSFDLALKCAIDAGYRSITHLTPDGMIDVDIDPILLP